MENYQHTTQYCSETVVIELFSSFVIPWGGPAFVCLVSIHTKQTTTKNDNATQPTHRPLQCQKHRRLCDTFKKGVGFRFFSFLLLLWKVQQHDRFLIAAGRPIMQQSLLVILVPCWPRHPWNIYVRAQRRSLLAPSQMRQCSNETVINTKVYVCASKAQINDSREWWTSRWFATSSSSWLSYVFLKPSIFWFGSEDLPM